MELIHQDAPIESEPVVLEVTIHIKINKDKYIKITKNYYSK